MSRRDLAIVYAYKIFILLLIKETKYRISNDDKVNNPNPRQKEISGKE